MRRKKAPVLSSVTITIVLLGLLLSSVNSPNPLMVARADVSASAFRGQFIAKMYTEALGRAPTQTEWQDWFDYFQPITRTCSTTTLQEVVEDFYTSQEFNDLGYDRAAALLALFRGALNHEPDEEGFLYYYSGDGATLSWPDTVHHLLYTHAVYSAEFNTLVTDPYIGICKNPGDSPFYETAPYGWDERQPKHPVLDIRALAYAQPSRTQAELQDDLYAAALPTGTGVVEISPTEVITINGYPPNTPLVIPKGVTLKTEGDPSPDHYAQMGRLVRAKFYTETWAIVILYAGSTLSGVWVDGQRGLIGGTADPRSMNISILDDGNPPSPITHTTLVENRLSDTIGGSLAQVWGAANGWTCGDVYVGANLLTEYANRHPRDPNPTAKLWADGIATECAHTTVEGNTLVDITDVGVVVFRGGLGIVQSSVVRNNVMLNAGNSAFGGFGADPFYTCAQPEFYDFSGTRFEGNIIWTSPTAHVDGVLYAGTYPWKFKCDAPYTVSHNTGSGATFMNNMTGNRGSCPSCTVRTNSPILASGMFDVAVQCNDLRTEIENLINCHYPGKDTPGEFIVLASVTEGWASFQEPAPLYTDVSLWECMGHVSSPVDPLYPPVPVWPCALSRSYLPLTYKPAQQSFTEGITNGGFEAGLAPAVEDSANRPWPVVCDWANPGNACRPGGGAYHVARRGAHSGDWAAWLGGYDRADDVLTQTVTIPPDLTAATLSFWRYIATAERTGAGDHLRVELRDSAGRLIAEFGRLDSQDRHRETWWPERWDVSAYLEPYRGQQIWLRFEATIDGNNRATSFFVDDVSLALAAPADLPLPPPEGGYPPPPERPLPPPATPQGGYPPPATPGPTPSPTPMPQLPVKPTRSPGP